jgi:hypothetical protein
MKTTLLQKPGPLTAPHFASNLEKAISDLKGELSATAKLTGATRKGWAKVEILGDDEEIVGELVRREYGTAHVDLQEVEMQGVYDCVTAKSTNDEMQLDFGIETPRLVNATIPLPTLRAQLADGRPIAYREIIENYCLVAGMKSSVRITKQTPERIEAWLSDEQIERFSDWVKTGLDRIVVFDCFKQQLESTISKAQLHRDIISVQSITLTTQVALCKLGTDAIDAEVRRQTQKKRPQAIHSQTNLGTMPPMVSVDARH